MKTNTFERVINYLDQVKEYYFNNYKVEIEYNDSFMDYVRFLAIDSKLKYDNVINILNDYVYNIELWQLVIFAKDKSLDGESPKKFILSVDFNGKN